MKMMANNLQHIISAAAMIRSINDKSNVGLLNEAVTIDATVHIKLH